MGVCVVVVMVGCGSVVQDPDASSHIDSSSQPDAASCPAATPDQCGPICTDTDTDPDNCGACAAAGGAVCDPALEECIGGECARKTCDDFEIPDTTTIPGWTEHSTSGDFSIVGGQLQGTGNLNVYQNTITMDGTTETDGCATLDVNYGAGTTLRSIGIVLRWNGPTDFIVALIQDNTSTGTFNSMWIYEYPGEVQLANNSTALLGTSPSIRGSALGDQVTLEVDIDRDGVFDQTLTGTTTRVLPGVDGVMSLAFGTPAFIEGFCWGCQ